MKTRYLPVNASERVTWLNTFNQKLPEAAAALAITPAQLTSVDKDAKLYAYVVTTIEGARDFIKQFTEFMKVLSKAPQGTPISTVPTFVQLPTPDAVASGIFTRIGKLVIAIKSNPGYTEAIGMSLGIVGSLKSVNKQSLKPLLEVKAVVGKPEIVHKIGESDSIHLYADHADGKGMVYLTNTTLKRFTDNTPLPQGVNAAVWQYMAIYVMDDEEVGEFSDVVSVTVSRAV